MDFKALLSGKASRNVAEKGPCLWRGAVGLGGGVFQNSPLQVAVGKFVRFVLPGLLLLKKVYILSYYSANFRYFPPTEASASLRGQVKGVFIPAPTQMAASPPGPMTAAG